MHYMHDNIVFVQMQVEILSTLTKAATSKNFRVPFPGFRTYEVS